MKSATVAALILIDCGLTLRQEKCYNFTVTDSMKKKFNANTIYQISNEDDILKDLAEAAPFEFLINVCYCYNTVQCDICYCIAQC